MCPGQLDLRHVAGYAFVFGNRTGLGAGFSAGMTTQTSGIEIHGLRFEVVVRIVAGHAADARVLRVIALAAGQPVRLEADIRNTRIGLRGDFRPCAVALPAELGSLLSRKAAKCSSVDW